MTFSETVKTIAGRWVPRRREGGLYLSLDLSPKHHAAILDAYGVEGTGEPGDLPPHSTSRAACVLMSRELVLVDGRWREIARVARVACEPPQTLLHLTDGGILGSRFDFPYVSRDVEEQALAAKDGAA